MRLTNVVDRPRACSLCRPLRHQLQSGVFIQLSRTLPFRVQRRGHAGGNAVHAAWQDAVLLTQERERHAERHECQRLAIDLRMEPADTTAQRPRDQPLDRERHVDGELQSFAAGR